MKINDVPPEAADENPRLEVRPTENRGRGVFALVPISAGAHVLKFQGAILKSAELTDDLLAMQIGPDKWLCSDGSFLDDCVNHSCEPNAGFTEGTPELYALRDISIGDEITWDYSTSIGEPGWTLDCRCGSKVCRGVVRAWPELEPEVRERLRPIALKYLQDD